MENRWIVGMQWYFEGNEMKYKCMCICAAHKNAHTHTHTQTHRTEKHKSILRSGLNLFIK
jgi:hypothetical protein